MNWEMEPLFEPCLPSSETWTVYSFLALLKSQDGVFDGKLPASGLGIVDAKMLGLAVLQLFCLMDLKHPKQPAAFDTSLLSEHLNDWQALPDTPMMFSLWTQAPKVLTYWWLDSLRAILHPFQSLAMANRYLPDAGFLPSRHQLILSPTSEMKALTYSMF